MSVRIHQGYFQSPTLFNIVLGCIMTDALKGHIGTINIRWYTITNLQFADDTDRLVGNELMNYLNETKIKHCWRSVLRQQKPRKAVRISGQQLETVKQYKYLSNIISEEKSKIEVLAWAVQIATAITRLKPIHIYSIPLPQAKCDTRSIFKQSLTGLNLGFFFS